MNTLSVCQEPSTQTHNTNTKTTDTMAQNNTNNQQLSMTTGAVNTRNRRAAEDGQKNTLRGKIDDDIWEDAEAITHTTPAGKVFVAAAAMLDRVEGDAQGAIGSLRRMMEELRREKDALKAENETLKKKLADANLE